MANLYYRDVFGNAAAIFETKENTFRLIIKNKAGTRIKDQPYKNLHGAKTALGMAGPWIEVFPKKSPAIGTS